MQTFVRRILTSNLGQEKLNVSMQKIPERQTIFSAILF